ncbi:DsrE/DsrF/DsrH-like protein [Natranaerovirga hydrolytica]|uniref:DsrE/DsrF/DsrH-like protein n=1 Tax=Natranaerovirga hydrolytica TaxID=680378 RepID=A0A4R1MJB4_9FIRM|nr:cytoplasmic protein [Natranaerovirga hydrolytica]TCK92796.1 DsrE/DsrF/DsrH-like protein [Natranaerovirga hydrolytica]
MEKIAMFAFKGEKMCFVHVLLNALDMKSKNMDVEVILEGESVKLIKELSESNHTLFKQALEVGLIGGICKACSAQMGVLEYNEKTEIPLLDDMNGHPGMARYIEKGYQIITL